MLVHRRGHPPRMESVQDVSASQAQPPSYLGLSFQTFRTRLLNMPLISADIWVIPLACVEYKTVTKQQRKAHAFEMKHVRLLKCGYNKHFQLMHFHMQALTSQNKRTPEPLISKYSCVLLVQDVQGGSVVRAYFSAGFSHLSMWV